MKKVGEHWDGRLRVSSTYKSPTFEQLDRLAAACGITRTTLQTFLVEMCLQNENVIIYVQDKYKKSARFWIIPSKVNGDLKYIFAERLAR
jgi:hypothetical protein